MARWFRLVFITISSAATSLSAAVALNDNLDNIGSDLDIHDDPNQQLLDLLHSSMHPLKDSQPYRTLLTMTRSAIVSQSSPTQSTTPAHLIPRAAATTVTLSSTSVPSDTNIHDQGLAPGQVTAIVLGCVILVAATIILYLKWGALMRVLNSGYYQSGHHRIENRQSKDSSQLPCVKPNLRAGKQMRELPSLEVLEDPGVRGSRLKEVEK